MPNSLNTARRRRPLAMRIRSELTGAGTPTRLSTGWRRRTSFSRGGFLSSTSGTTRGWSVFSVTCSDRSSRALFDEQDVDAGLLAVARQLDEARRVAIRAPKFPGSVDGVLRRDRPWRLVQPAGIERGHGIDRSVGIPAGADRRSIRSNGLLDPDQRCALVDRKVLGDAKCASRVPSLRQGVCGRQPADNEEPANRADNDDSHPVQAPALRPNDWRWRGRSARWRSRKWRVHRW